MNKRIHYIDVAKSIGIIAIVFGHVLQGGYLHYTLYAFHVPLFFFLSGFVFKNKDNLLTFTKKKFKSLLIPYYIFGILSILIYTSLGNIATHVLGKDLSNLNFSLLDNIFGLLYANIYTGLMLWNRPLWFLPCLFITSLMTLLLEKYIITNNQTKRFIVLLFNLLIGFILSSSGIYFVLPLQFFVAIHMLVWMELGISLKYFLTLYPIPKTIESQYKYLVMGIVALVPASMLAQLNPIEVVANCYGNYFIYLLNASIFILLILIISYYLQNITFLNELGKHTLFILGLHKFPVLFFQTVFPFTKTWLKDVNSFQGITSAIIVTIISILLCLLAEYLFNKFILKK